MAVITCRDSWMWLWIMNGRLDLSPPSTAVSHLPLLLITWPTFPLNWRTQPLQLEPAINQKASGSQLSPTPIYAARAALPRSLSHPVLSIKIEISALPHSGTQRCFFMCASQLCWNWHKLFSHNFIAVYSYLEETEDLFEDVNFWRMHFGFGSEYTAKIGN